MISNPTKISIMIVIIIFSYFLTKIIFYCYNRFILQIKICKGCKIPVLKGQYLLTKNKDPICYECIKKEINGD